MHSKCAALSRSFLALSLLAPLSQADNLGAWEDEAFTTVELYVSATSGSNASNGLAPTSAVQTITTALAIASAIQSGEPAPVTINVMAGTYDTALGEQFPLSMPAFGVALENFEPGAVIDGSLPFSGLVPELLAVDALGDDQLPASVIRGLVFDNSNSAVRIRGNGSFTPSNSKLIEVTVRDCEFLDNRFALTIDGFSGFNHEIVVERNLVLPSSKQPRGFLEFIVPTAPDLYSSTLYRGNRISNCSNGIDCQGGASPAQNRPRLMSNVVQLCETNVLINACNALLANNTIAFAHANGPFMGTRLGLSVDNCTVTDVNNLYFNPSNGSGPMGSVAADVLVSASGALNTTTSLTLGATAGVAGAQQPQFAAGDAHPGAGVMGGAPVPANVRLAQNSTLVNAGTNAAIAGPATTALPFFVGLSGRTRADVSMDFERDARVLGAAVDVGADEVALTSLRLPVMAGQQDSIGNLHPASPGTYNIDFQMNAPAGNVAILMFSTLFFDTVGTAPVLRNNALYANQILLPGMGNLLLQPGFLITAVPSTPIPPSGTLSTTFTFPGSVPDLLLEAEVYYQLLTAAPTGTLTLSNRVVTEFNL